MKGVRFVTNDKDQKIAVQIDLDQLTKYQESIEELLDVIVAESRKDDGEISWEELKKQLKASGKL